jgi:hypothetical protein
VIFSCDLLMELVPLLTSFYFKYYLQVLCDMFDKENNIIQNQHHMYLEQ